MSTLSNGSESDGSSSIRKKGFTIPIEEEIEPYVRRRRLSSERNRKRLEKLTEEEQNLLRTSINSRERRRMHDLNDALDELRSVLPYSNSTTARRLSKINTIILASNCIRNLNKRFEDVVAENEQLRALIPEDKLSTIKLPPFQLATITALPASDSIHSAAKIRRLSQSLSATPPGRPDLDAQSTSVNIKTKDEPSLTTPQSTSHRPTSAVVEPTSVFPMAFLAAFNLQQQSRTLPPPHPSAAFPTSPSQFCMKRFNPMALCACVGCFMHTASVNAAFFRGQIRPTFNK